MLFLNGCGSEARTVYKYSRFVEVERYKDLIVYTDTDTGISYGYYNKSMFPLYDVDGSLYRANGWRDYG